MIIDFFFFLVTNLLWNNWLENISSVWLKAVSNSGCPEWVGIICFHSLRVTPVTLTFASAHHGRRRSLFLVYVCLAEQRSGEWQSQRLILIGSSYFGVSSSRRLSLELITLNNTPWCRSSCSLLLSGVSTGSPFSSGSALLLFFLPPSLPRSLTLAACNLFLFISTFPCFVYTAPSFLLPLSSVNQPGVSQGH